MKEFGLDVCECLQRNSLQRLIGGKWYSEEMLKSPAVLRKFGFNDREIRFLEQNDWSDLELPFLKPYLENFEDEYDPFSAGVSHLDEMSIGELLTREGASAAALARIGGTESALHSLWHAAIVQLRGVPLSPRKVFRLTGGNQKICDAFADHLGDRILLGCPVTGIVQGDSAIQVRYKAFGREEKTLDADFAASCINLSQLVELSMQPRWGQRKQEAIELLNYNSNTRVVIQSRTKFWEQDGLSPNLSPGPPSLSNIWQMAADVPTGRGLLEGTAPGLATPEAVLDSFRAVYPGRSDDIEQVHVLRWPEEPWCSNCETVGCRPGQLRKIWPAIIEPWGRLHFAGAYADNLNWGMEAATRSANRVAGQISEGISGETLA